MTTGPFEAAGALPLHILFFRKHMDVLLCCSPSLSFPTLKRVCCCGTRVTLWLVLGYPGVNSFCGGQTNKPTTKLIFKTFDMAVTPVTHNNRQKCLHSELSSECSFYLLPPLHFCDHRLLSAILCLSLHRVCILCMYVF